VKRIDFEIRKAYVNSLTGLQYNGTTVPVYDMEAPSGVNRPFIILGSQVQNNDLNTKDSFGGTAIINVEVNTDTISYIGGRKQANEISSLILETIHPEPDTINLTSENFNIITVDLIGTFEGLGNGDSNTVYRDVMILQHKYFEI